MQKYQNVVIDAAGNAVASVTITVYTAGTLSLASLFSDNAVTAKANPFVTDATGNIAFYAANGRYDIKLTKTGYTFGTDLYDTCLFDSADFTPAALNESALNNLCLVKSGANLTLTRVGGSLININGTVRTMTTAPTLAPTTFEASHLYYVYASWSGTDIALTASETAYTIDTATGRPQKNGDTLYRLVGMAYTTAGGAWADSATQRFVLSRDNRRGIPVYNGLGENKTSGATSVTEIDSTKRIEFLAWSDDTVSLSISGSASNSDVATMLTSIAVDGVVENVDTYSQETVGGATYQVSCSQTTLVVLTDGYHYATMVGFVTAGSGTWNGGATNSARCTIRGLIRG